MWMIFVPHRKLASRLPQLVTVLFQLIVPTMQRNISLTGTYNSK
jgi:hypothetical protein